MVLVATNTPATSHPLCLRTLQIYIHTHIYIYIHTHTDPRILLILCTCTYLVMYLFTPVTKIPHSKLFSHCHNHCPPWTLYLCAGHMYSSAHPITSLQSCLIPYETVMQSFSSSLQIMRKISQSQSIGMHNSAKPFFSHPPCERPIIAQTQKYYIYCPPL